MGTTTDTTSDARRRCDWATASALMMAYHDEQWGVPLHGERELFEMLTLGQLLSGETAQEVSDTLLNQPLPTPSEAAPGRGIPPALELICRKALEKEKRNRYPSVQALLEALKAYRPVGVAA